MTRMTTRGGEMSQRGEKLRRTAKPSGTTSSISDRLKKPRVDPWKSPKADIKGAAKHAGDEAIKGEKTEDELETTNSDENKNRSEKAESVRMFDSDMLNQPRAKRKRRQQKERQYHDSKGAEKGRVSRQADRNGRIARSRTGRGARARRGARRNRSGDPGDPEESQVELEEQC